MGLSHAGKPPASPFDPALSAPHGCHTDTCHTNRWTGPAGFEKLAPVKQSIVTLDMEGVLTPEIWIAVAEKTGIKELRRTTRDEPDYDKLMRGRLRFSTSMA